GGHVVELLLVHDEPAGAAVGEAVADLGRGVDVLERNHDDARSPASEVADDQLGTVREQRRHAFAGEIGVGEYCREPRRPLAELRERQATVTARDGGLVGMTIAGVVQPPCEANGAAHDAACPATQPIHQPEAFPIVDLLGVARLSTDMRRGSPSGPSCERSQEVSGGFTCWRYCGGTSSQRLVRCTTP